MIDRFYLGVLILMACGLSACTAPTSRTPDTMTTRELGVLSRGVNVPMTWTMPAAKQGALPLVIMVHGHGGSRHEAGAFDQLAQRLASAGIASIRMDFPGCGDSDESFANNNLTNMGADISAARAQALTLATIDPERIALVGFSMGGRLSAIESERNDYAAIAFWAPSLVNGADDLYDMFGGRANYDQAKAVAAENGSTDFVTSWGQEQVLGVDWFVDLERSRPMDAIAKFDGDLLFVHGTADAVVPIAVSKTAMQNAVRARSVATHWIDNADHGFGLFSEQPQYWTELLNETEQFLRRTLR
ncbi:MAG: alpha/beta hydrolase family protein [Woeseiaceae bacterium]